MSNYVNLLDIVYPVGSIIASYSSTSPANWIGGTWETMTGFLRGATSSIGTSGGSETHSHSLAGTGYAKIGATGNNVNAIGYNVATVANMGNVTSYTVFGSSSTSASRNFNHWTNLAGGTSNTTNLPPYTNVYYYRRTA